MAQIFKPSKTKQSNAQDRQDIVGKVLEINISHLDHLARGVCSTHQPVIFVEGALPDETVKVRITEAKAHFWQAKSVENIISNPFRKTPVCQHFKECGGCQTQHCESAKILEYKQHAIAQMISRTSLASNAKSDNKKRLIKQSMKRRASSSQNLKIADIQPNLPWQQPVVKGELGYRRKTRISIDARDPQNLRFGFKQKQSNSIVDIVECPILATQLEELVLPLKQIFKALANPSAIGHINLVSGDNGVLVNFRVTKQLSSSDREQLTEFGLQYKCQVRLQAQEHQHEWLTDNQSLLTYTPTQKIVAEFEADDFIQVNSQVNQLMVAQALSWLDLNDQDKLLDLYCGTGNFSLPASRLCAEVVGVEGVTKMVRTAQKNAQRNGIDNATFVEVDLNDNSALQKQQFTSFNKVLLDPAREGARVAIDEIVLLAPSHVLYVSCNPASFARDSAKLLESQYRISKIALIDMFPQTAHTELMALFVRQT